ncbi:MAG: CrcB family protein [Victivallaceae bacterium]|nr:CrcB family protein [Victivallaceae bacterium]
MNIFWKLVLIAAAGALGTLARYGLGNLVQRTMNSVFPYGTLAVNLAGTFLCGFIWVLCERKLQLNGTFRIIVLLGFTGGFTTFSTFMLETGIMIQDSEWLRAGGNLILQNAFGMAALFAGIILGRLV